MHFELIQLYRNYRNIENVDIDIESGEAIVFGHFDRINFKNSDTADEALDILYDQYISNNTKTNEKSDVQPIALFTYDDKKIKSSAEMCTAVSFMQISKPSDCIDIKTFYEYASEAINTTISELKSQNVIDDVEANIYIPLSFMNIAVIFYAKNLTDICNVVKNILHNKIASFQYSVLSFPKDFCLQHQTDKNINISLRFIWKKHTNTKKVVDLLKDALSKAQICHYTINHLLGNNDGLLTVSGDGYKIIKMFLNKQNEFSEFIKHVENTRASIYFPDRDIKLVKLSCICESPANYVADNSLIYVAEQKLINALIDLKKSSPLLQKSDINDIIYKVTEFGKFINVVSKHARKGIATSLYLSIKSPYLLFLKIALEKIELIGTKYKRDSVLERIGSVMKDMLAYYGNIFHCNLGFFEERGFYNNIIGLASNVELAYNKYANCICDVAMSEFERNVQKLKIECSVTSDNDPVICTNDIFDNVKDQETDNSLLINVNIPVSYVFKYKSVSHIIIHEIAHYVGERKRESRAYAMCKTITAAICDVIYQGFVLSPLPSLSKNELDFLNKYEKTDAYILMHQEMKNKIYEILFNYINDSFLKKCNTSFYMNRTVNSLIEVINELPQNNDLIVSLTEELVNFQFWYYENIEDFYLQNSDDNLKSELIIQISDYALKGYNRHFAKRIILSA